MVWHWNCASALCHNSWRTKGVHYYNLPTDFELRRKYAKVLRNDNVNWNKQVICSAHWKGGKRLSKDHVPDITCSEEQVKKFKKASEKRPENTEIKKKLVCAERTRKQDSRISLKRKAPTDRSTIQPIKKKRRKSYRNLEKEVVKVEAERDQLKNQLRLENQHLISQLGTQLSELKRLEKEIDALQEKLQSQTGIFEKKFKEMKFELSKKTFSYKCLIQNAKEFFYLCGLTTNEFDCVFACLEPFTHLLIYPDCIHKDKNKDFNNKLLDEKTELIVALTIARHSVNLGVMAKLVGASASTMSRVFVAWMVLIRCVFESINLKPLPGFIEAFLPKKFVDAGYSECGILGDNTETWVSQFENYEINNITFSHYKNHTTGKVSVWIYPHGSLCKCSDAYPGTISDEHITEQIEVLDLCPKGKIVMTDKGFAITDLCHDKGLHHNRPPMKFNEQYDENEVNLNFDIATLRIYNENAIGRIRDWSILNTCWPAGRVDLLGTCWIALAHVVNVTKGPVGPKDDK